MRTPKNSTLPGLQQLGRVGWLPVERGEQFHGLADVDEQRQRAFLQLDSDPLPDRGPVGLWVQAEHPYRAGVRDPQPRDALDGRRLPGAVRSDDAEDLSPLDTERHVLHSDAGAVGLAQVVNRDDGP
jgi:ATP-binding cassette, subfamily B, bacterial